VFTGPQGAPLRHGTYYGKHFRPAVRQLVKSGEWPESLSALRFHDLRHTAAALLIKQGTHPKAISERLGHSGIAITMDLYGHLYEGHDAELLEGLEKTFREARKDDGKVVRLR